MSEASERGILKKKVFGQKSSALRWRVELVSAWTRFLRANGARSLMEFGWIYLLQLAASVTKVALILRGVVDEKCGMMFSKFKISFRVIRSCRIAPFWFVLAFVCHQVEYYARSLMRLDTYAYQVALRCTRSTINPHPQNYLDSQRITLACFSRQIPPLKIPCISQQP